MIINSGALRNTTPNFAYFEFTNPTAVSGAGNYIIAVASNPTLASVRALDSLVVHYDTSGGNGSVLCAEGCNQSHKLPLASFGVGCQASVRMSASGEATTGNTHYAISDTTDTDTAVASGPGRIHITEGGDLRIYGNTNAYPIPAGKIAIYVRW